MAPGPDVGCAESDFFLDSIGGSAFGYLHIGCIVGHFGGKHLGSIVGHRH
jgi:hypothetical protein